MTLKTRPAVLRGGIDGYGVEWMYVDVVGGAMVKPGSPKCPDITEWEKYVAYPTRTAGTGRAALSATGKKLSPERCTYIAVPGCLFERLIAILDFQNAALALIDDEQKDAVHRFFKTVNRCA